MLEKGLEEITRGAALKEIVALKQFCYPFELKQIDIKTLKCRTSNSLYDQMCDRRISRRAFELSKLCGQNFSSSLTWYVPSIMDFEETTYYLRVGKYNSNMRHYTALEFYLEKLEWRNDRIKFENIIHFLKSEITYEQFIKIYES